MKKIELKAETREEKNGRAKDIRTKGFLPAIIYGPGAANRGLKVKKNDFEHVWRIAGESQIIELIIDGKEKIKALIKDVQINPIKDNIFHIDFYQVDMKKKIEVEIPLHFIGEAPALKELGGTLVKNIEALEVKCMPDDLIEKIDVDISILKTFDDHIRVKDLKLPETMELLSNPDDIIVGVSETKVEVEPIAAPVETVEGGEAKEEKTEGKEDENKNEVK